MCTGRRLNVSPKIRNKAMMHTKTNPIQYCTRSLSKCNKRRKVNVRHKGWKWRNKIVPICRQHDCLCIKFQIIYNDNNNNSSRMKIRI